MNSTCSERRVNIIQGQFYVSADPNVVVTTLLGSCVAACIRDPLAGVGGINHFLLPAKGDGGDSESIGVHLMELLLNGLLKAGAQRCRLEAKIFGGARTVEGLSDIGQQNAKFAERFIRDEGVAFVGGSVGGTRGRRIQYWPVTGRARQSLMDSTASIERRIERAPMPVISNAGELELF